MTNLATTSKAQEKVLGRELAELGLDDMNLEALGLLVLPASDLWSLQKLGAYLEVRVGSYK